MALLPPHGDTACGETRARARTIRERIDTDRHREKALQKQVVMRIRLAASRH